MYIILLASANRVLTSCANLNLERIAKLDLDPTEPVEHVLGKYLFCVHHHLRHLESSVDDFVFKLLDFIGFNEGHLLIL